MAENLSIGNQEGGFRTVSHHATDLDFSGDSEVSVTIDELRHVEGVESVQATAYGSGDSNGNEGRVVAAVDVNPSAGDTNVVVLHAYQGGGAGSPLDDDTAGDVDHVLIKARGY